MLDRQNEEKNILLLKAMRHTYNRAKKVYGIRMTIGVFIPISSIIFSLLNQYGITGDFSSLFSILGLVWLPVFYFLNQLENNEIGNGAKIQEEFDTNVFSLPWNKALVRTRISPEDIQEKAIFYKGNISTLRDWYVGLDSKHYLVNVLLAQRSNLMWAVSLKKRFSKLILIVSILYLIITVAYACFIDMSMQSYLMIIFLPSISVLLYGVSTWWELRKQSNIICELGEDIRIDCEKFVSNEIDLDITYCRQYQDAIYVYNRTNSVLIPEWLYWMRRKKDDEKMLEVNRRLSKESNKRES
ncbi:S-4TM family putative pore-forming effector [Aquisalibacillus elongatus]|uniref:Uncharacterized protein n=1 Tax=Aquisalibacillus elongatus TaxID=485577 RepID=A0A3N5BXC4_9BACI|nr:S-4TM family putative pore-forming effector [Aquisalibacillus elongatus]RPF54428.1 hypothetical protein EDC24_1627 [Aquisalibacillus elongatus]